MSAPPSLGLVQQNLRARICSHCRYRTKGTRTWNPCAPRPCEARCELFRYVPHLTRIAIQIDSLVGSRNHAVTKAISDCCARCGRGCDAGALWRYRDQIAQVLIGIAAG